MAKVHVLNVCVLDNPAKFATKFEFEITFECVEDLPGTYTLYGKKQAQSMTYYL